MNQTELCHVGPTSFHDEIGSERYPFESGRYWLFTSKLCPFAHRTELTRKLTGMDRHIGLTVAGSIQTEQGWNLGEIYAGEGNTTSPVVGIDRLPGIYELASPGYNGRASVPVLFDTKSQTIVNNESAEIIRMFDKLADGHPYHQTLYPQALRSNIDELIRLLNEEYITPLYRAGFAQDQADYERNYNSVFAALNRLEFHLLTTGPYLAGAQVTLADVHAYPHLVRFDAIYHTLYRLNKNFMYEYKNITAYLGRLAKMPAFASSLDLQASKDGYFLSWNQPTNANFVPAGPVVNPHSGVAVAAAQAA